MNQLRIFGLLAMAGVLSSCFDDDKPTHGGVIITTNSQPMARAYVYEQGNPQIILDSVVSSGGRFEFDHLETSKTYVVWLSQDSLTGAWATDLRTGSQIQLSPESYRWVSLDLNSKSGSAPNWRGYFGIRSSVNGILKLPVLSGAAHQIWQAENSDQRIDVQNQGETVQVLYQGQVLVPMSAAQSSSVAISSSSVLALSSSISTYSLSSSATSLLTLPDARDGISYPLVKIGQSYWFMANLGYSSSSFVTKCPNNDANKCATHGRLYDWTAAQTACPAGSHLPDTLEFQALIQNCGGAGLASNSLRAKTWSGGTDGCGFAALPAGEVTSQGYASNFDKAADFWIRGENSAGFPQDFFIVPAATPPVIQVVARGDYRSVRCIRD